MKIQDLYRCFLSCNGVTTDSRTCTPGSMFIALRGTSFNGNTFAAQALAAGCKYVVIDDYHYADPNDARILFVDDSLLTLQDLARVHRRAMKAKVIGITGTNGKTTTKELISAVLSKSYQVLSTEGNLNNHIGVPLTLLRLRPEHEFAVIEMGANHPGEIKTLAEIAEPDAGIITNVGMAHLEGFGSLQGVIRTKGELYDFLRKRPGAVTFIHRDNPHLMEISQKLLLIRYGTAGNLFVNGTVTGNSPYLSFQWRVGALGAMHTVQTQLIGDYNFPNALAAATVGTYYHVSPAAICRALGEYQPNNNRSQLKKTESNTLIIDAYNANPTSMMAALTNFLSMDAPDKLLILGDMLELGKESAAQHRAVVEYLQAGGFKNITLVGSHFMDLRPPFPAYRTVEALIRHLKKEKPTGQTILLKGSHGVHLEQLVEWL